MLQELAREEPGNARHHVALAEIFDERGDAKRARQHWRAAHRVSPDRADVARAIGAIEGEDRALVRVRQDAERSVVVMLGDVADQLDLRARGALVGAEQDWSALEAGDDHSTVVTQLAKAVEVELMRRLFAPFKESTSSRPLENVGAELRGFSQWYRGEIATLSLGEMQFAISRRTVFGSEGRRGLIAELVARFPLSA